MIHRISSKVIVLALVVAGALSIVPVAISWAASNEGPTKSDADSPNRFRNNNAFGDSYPGVSRQMDYVVSNDDFTDIFISDILVYMPTPNGTINIIGGDLCTNSAVNVRSSDANYTNTPNGTRATDFRIYRGTTSLIPQDYQAGRWNYGGAGACSNGVLPLAASGMTKDPDTNMYIYRIEAKANLATGGKFANGFHIVAPPGSYVSQDSTKRTQHFGMQASLPIPSGNNPAVANPPNPYKVYTDVDIPFGPDCSLPVGSSRNVSFDIYDSDNVNNFDVQPRPFNVRIERYTRAGGYLGPAPMVSVVRATDIGGNVYQPTSTNQQTSTFTFTARGDEKYILRVNRLYYNNTLQFSIPFDSVFFFKQCQTALTSTVKPTATLSPQIAMPGQTFTGTSSINYVGPVNTPAQVDARRLVWSDTNHDGTYDAGEPIHFDQTANNITIPAAGRALPPWTDVADPGKYGNRVCFGLFLTPANATTRTNPASDIDCSEIARKPKLQVWGGDVRVQGRIETSVSPFDPNDYGSWGEYGVLSTGVNAGFASGSGLNNGTNSPDSRPWNMLTFANRNNGAPSYGTFTPMAPTSLSAQFPAVIPAVAPAGNLGSLASGTYQTANLTITPSTIGQQAGKGKKIIIRATGTVTISGDITYQGAAGNTFNSADQIPQVVIIANKINIQGSVKNIDAWLLTTGATGAINTCSDVAPAAALNSTICPNRLTVNGPLETAHLYLRRTGGSGSTPATAGDPAEVFNLRGDAYIWGRTQAAQNGKAQTVYSKELPPRF